MAKYLLVSFKTCPWVQRAAIVLREKGVPFEFRHIDRKGLRDDAPARSWNSSHPSRGPDGGCSQADLRSTGGDGLFYCFATQ